MLETHPPVCTCMFYIIPYSSALYVIKSFLLFFIILSLLRKNGYEIFNRYDKMNSLSLLYTVIYYQSNRRYIINGKKILSSDSPVDRLPSSIAVSTVSFLKVSPILTRSNMYMVW